MKVVQEEMFKTKKQVRVSIDTDVIRLAKSKAASQEITLSVAIEKLLRKWIAGSEAREGK